MSTILRSIALIFLLTTLVTGQSKVGSTAAPFLNVGIGPRALSMGGAFVATANDVTALYWNPAGASRTQINGALFSHTRWFADITYNWAGVMVRAGDLGTAGLSLTYLDYGKMEVTTLSEQEGTGEIFSAHDLALALSFAHNLTDKFSLGINIKYIHQQIWNTSARAIAVDVGTLFISDIYGMRIGATISNFGTDMQLDGKDLYVLHDISPGINGNNDQILAKLNTDPYPLPLIFRVGLAKDFMFSDNHRITIAADALHPNDNDEALDVGTEYSFHENIFLRAGYKSLGLRNSAEGLGVGFGLQYGFSTNFILSMDYAYQSFGILSYTQHFSMGVRF